jgi:flagellar motor component MotA
MDLNSLIVVIVIGALFAAAAKGEESLVQKFGNGAVRAGWLGSIIGIIAVFGSDGFAAGDLSMLGSAMAVCSLTVFYGYVFKLGAMILD